MMLDVSDRLIVIIGGGSVAVRKASGLLAAGARRVRVIAPDFSADMPAEVERIAEGYRAELLEGAGLVFAATDDPQVNQAVVLECRRRNVLVCRADTDEDAPGDFATPALHQEGAITLTVSAGGAPALAATVRDALASALERRWVLMAGAMQVLRPMIRESGVDLPTRRRIFRDLAGEEAMDRLEHDGLTRLWGWLKQRYPSLSPVSAPDDDENLNPEP